MKRLALDGTRAIGHFTATVRAVGIAAALAMGSLTTSGCEGTGDTSVERSNLAALRACHLDDGTVEHTAQIHVCAPGDTHKTTICHIPPGNPANAHTLCIGNAAVPAHLENHGDSLGQCQHEEPCPPPPTSGAAGTGAPGGAAGASGTSGSGGAAGTGGASVIDVG
jgi:uncharacterized membrane protein YgcG